MQDEDAPLLAALVIAGVSAASRLLGRLARPRLRWDADTAGNADETTPYPGGIGCASNEYIDRTEVRGGAER